ncbi:MAG TPA: lysylphosphatidylglycerol synthase transmembrane domain-containing protein [Myxococcota bacterium]|nr:lysylphosphatidylglycerol synthase transmembrane domain-containing protein [Myxococcota bacterium]HOA12832.1 lysylphosphatidylglycerol synthase transmembrane domain-containing protein [Myxococcota bacterium]HOC99571.1 lysylphosphatidylglycerol synthase transmembrane domain-containing protein [Myxococcota bacterium]HOH76536.1 lysylphosphatidylglycerol synthase transmembrane domain-containing protein [Myxococcota bacterium]
MNIPEIQPDEPVAMPARKPAGPVMRIVATVTVVMGVAGIAWIIHSVGLDSLGQVMSNLSIPKFLVLLGWYYLMFLFDTLAWRQLIRKADRPSVWALWKAAIAGASINQLTPGGNIGEPLKIMVLKNKGDLKEIIASLVAWNFMHLSTTMVCVLVGAIPIFMFLKADFTFVLLYLGGALILGLPAALILATFRYNILSRMASLVARLGFKADRLMNWQQKVHSIEKNVVAVIRERPKDVAISFVHLLASRFISITMTFGMVWVLNIDIPFVTVIYVQMLNLAVSTLFSFVPARVGVFEGYNAIIFKALEYTPQAGLAVSIITRVIQVITTVIGVLILARPMLDARHRDGRR